jgi:hypothetical protein
VAIDLAFPSRFARCEWREQALWSRGESARQAAEKRLWITAGFFGAARTDNLASLDNISKKGKDMN